MSDEIAYPCKSKACAIQACLIRHNYDADKCAKERLAFEHCCRQALAEGNQAAKEACGFIWKKWERETRKPDQH